MVAQIDERLGELDRALDAVGDLMAERRRLLQARATLTGERHPREGSLVRRVTQDEVADFLAGHPGSRAKEISRELGVALTTISQHLHRGRESRFERRADGWHLRQAPR